MNVIKQKMKLSKIVSLFVILAINIYVLYAKINIIKNIIPLIMMIKIFYVINIMNLIFHIAMNVKMIYV